MSTSHHGMPASQEPEDSTIRRMLEQLQGTAKREYPRGRMGAEDDGALSFAVAADKENGVIVIRFGKPVEWIGLAPEDASKLITLLVQKMREVKHDEPVHITFG